MPALDKAFLKTLNIEPLDRHKHDRAAFDSGVTKVNNFLISTAGRHHQDDQSKTYVAVMAGTVKVIGFYTLRPHAIAVDALPPEIQKKLGRSDTVGAIYLAVVGVDKSAANKGLGRKLMSHFLGLCMKVIDQIGGKFIVLDAIDAKTADFYRKLGFVDLPSQANRMLISAETVRKSMGE
ncbi:MAG: GNAT family N-acetyltransferase [Azospirillaceae bacterium]|nr:GNAT family N-acetyltransferase [Azospirillaceae bacterium]